MLWQERLFIVHLGIFLIFVSSMLCLPPNSQYLKCSFGSSGTGAGMDIVVSSVRAYISALNKMLGFKDQSKPKVSADRSQDSVWQVTPQVSCGPRLPSCQRSKSRTSLFIVQRWGRISRTSLLLPSLFLFYFCFPFFFLLVCYLLCIWRQKMGLFCLKVQKGILVVDNWIYVLFLKNNWVKC